LQASGAFKKAALTSGAYKRRLQAALTSGAKRRKNFKIPIDKINIARRYTPATRR
jgi:hypothetical protein